VFKISILNTKKSHRSGWLWDVTYT